MTHIYTIAPHAPFLQTLRDRVLDGALLGGWERTGPFWLADVTIVLPTRRARLALAEAFMQRGEFLLPDIRALGAEAGDEEAFLDPMDASGQASPIATMERRLILARLVEQWAQSSEGAAILATPPNPAEILALADSLARLIDDITIEGADIGLLDARTAELDLAENWARNRKFLDLVLRSWPEILKERGKADMADLRNARLRRQAETAASIHEDRPVIAAGSTGSIPATADLLGAIARLPRGAVVLPGLDRNLGASELRELRDDRANPHGHSQYGLVRLLDRLKVTPIEVQELAAEPSSRTSLVNKALALAGGTADWAEARTALQNGLESASSGIALLAARTADEEARAIALAARGALSSGKTVGIVTPDRTLARRIAVELDRHGVEVDDAAGTPLYQTAAGRLARQLLTLAAGEFAAVDLVAQLRNRATTLGLPRSEVGRRADLLELKLLRGHRLRPGLAGLRSALAGNLAGAKAYRFTPLSEADALAVGDLLDRLQVALDPLCTVLSGTAIDAASLAAALRGAIAAVAGQEAGPGSPELGNWLKDLAGRPGEGPRFEPNDLTGVLAALMAGVQVRETRPRRSDIVIWGQLEARLQSPGLMIVAGLNEDIWPAPADPGPWLSRGMRIAMGLEPPERQQGLAAHDFMMALGNEDLLLCYARRIGSSPALPSRLLQRLEAFIGERIADAMRARGDHWLQRARRIDAVGTFAPAARPLPQPPAEVRPRRLSITEVETLFRSPYDLYAKHVLKLRPLAPLGEEPDIRERGSMIHEVFGRFIDEGHPFDSDALPRLKVLAEEAFAGLDAIGERRTLWLKRFERAAQLFVAFEHQRNAEIASRHAEREGSWTFPALGGFMLTGRADRVDVRRDGSLEILDFKTGSVPTAKEMRGFEAPQLLLEGAMAQAVGLRGVTPAPVHELTYIKVGLGPDAFDPIPFKRDGDLQDAIDEASQRLQGHVSALLLSDSLPMAARIYPVVNRTWRGDYDHLARTDEWTLGEGAEEDDA